MRSRRQQQQQQQQQQQPRRHCEGPLQRDGPQGAAAPAPASTPAWELTARAGAGAGAPQQPARPVTLCAAADPWRRRSLLLLLLCAAVLASVPLGALSLGLGALGGQQQQQQHLGGDHSVHLPLPLPLDRALPSVGRVGAAVVGAGEAEGQAGVGKREEAGGSGGGSWRRRAGSRQLIENGEMAQVARWGTAGGRGGAGVGWPQSSKA